MQVWALKQKKSSGFTIVELLIVVVVIAILAAITIVAYNGIQNRAVTSAAQTAASQTVKKLKLYALDNNDQYPATLAAAGITDTTNLQYTGGGASYCVTATSQSVSYYLSNSVQAATAGACAGHGINGVPPITNLVVNPTFGSGNNIYSSGTGSQVSTNSVQPSGGPTGGSFYRRAYTAASVGFAAGADINTLGITTVAPGQAMTGSAYVRSSKAQAVQPQLQWLNASAGSSGVSNGTSVTLVANTWTRISVTGTAPATTVSFRLDLDGGSGAVQWANTDTLDYTMLMVTAGSTLYLYADGNTAGWDWTGVTNNSPSTGPPL